MIWSHIDLKKGSSWLSDLLLTAPFPLNKRERNRWIRERQRKGRRTQQLAIGIQMMMMPPDLDVCTCLPADGGVSSTTPLHALSKWGLYALYFAGKASGVRWGSGRRTPQAVREREREKVWHLLPPVAWGWGDRARLSVGEFSLVRKKEAHHNPENEWLLPPIVLRFFVGVSLIFLLVSQ